MGHSTKKNWGRGQMGLVARVWSLKTSGGVTAGEKASLPNEVISVNENRGAMHSYSTGPIMLPQGIVG